jgi:hypothetical protein
MFGVPDLVDVEGALAHERLAMPPGRVVQSISRSAATSYGISAIEVMVTVGTASGGASSVITYENGGGDTSVESRVVPCGNPGVALTPDVLAPGLRCRGSVSSPWRVCGVWDRCRDHPERRPSHRPFDVLWCRGVGAQVFGQASDCLPIASGPVRLPDGAVLEPVIQHKRGTRSVRPRLCLLERHRPQDQTRRHHSRRAWHDRPQPR